MDQDRSAAAAVAFGTSDAGEIGLVGGRATIHIRSNSWLFNGLDYERPSGSFAVDDHSAALGGFHFGRFRLRCGALNNLGFWNLHVIGITVPTWVMAGGAFGGVSVVVMRLIQRRPPHNPGICSRCGYDLRPAARISTAACFP